MLRTRRCPICDQPIAGPASAAAPFCSPRCQLIDLGRWLDEQYCVPVERLDDIDVEDCSADYP